MPSISEPQQPETQNDPRVQYFLQCKSSLNLPLPIFDKVMNKTLVLQNYTLSQGNCIGLAQACHALDPTKINRLLFNNCGIDGHQFA